MVPPTTCLVGVLLVLGPALATADGSWSCPALAPAAIGAEHPAYASKPFVDAVAGSGWTGDAITVTSPVVDEATGERAVLGRIPAMDANTAEKIAVEASEAWDRGQGVWPQMSLGQRIDALERVVQGLKAKRAEIVNLLTWEIAKSLPDAASEFDRTMTFVEKTIAAAREIDAELFPARMVSGVMARVRLAAIGVMLVLGPFNYPFNETYAALIPALLMGNVAVMKVPSVGGLVHLLTQEIYERELPPGTVSFITGSGRATMSPIMKSGLIDVLAFIGGSTAADKIIQAHPQPHRLSVFAQLEGKNLGIVMPDADLDVAVAQCVVGATSYNGQRCTAIKLIMVHRSIADDFLARFKAKVAELKTGLPWEDGVQITPLPEPKKPGYLESLLTDAVSKGAQVVNADVGGGEQRGALMTPAVVYPVTSEMRLWHEEQFGPVIPVAVYDDVSEIHRYIHDTPFGQQAAIFTQSAEAAGPLVDVLSTAVGRINLNTQCGRSPDVFPFSGRRSSALGTMSVAEALRVFSIETVVAAKANPVNEGLLSSIEASSSFMTPL